MSCSQPPRCHFQSDFRKCAPCPRAQTHWLEPPGRVQTVQLYEKCPERLCRLHPSVEAACLRGGIGGFSSNSDPRGSPRGHVPGGKQLRYPWGLQGPYAGVSISLFWGACVLRVCVPVLFSVGTSGCPSENTCTCPHLSKCVCVCAPLRPRFGRLEFGVPVFCPP